MSKCLLYCLYMYMYLLRPYSVYQNMRVVVGAGQGFAQKRTRRYINPIHVQGVQPLPQSPRGRNVGPPVFHFALVWSQDVRCRVVGLMVDIWPSSGSCPPRHFLWLEALRTGDASQMTPRFVWPIALIGP